jgi:hypothetical protein
MKKSVLAVICICLGLLLASCSFKFTKDISTETAFGTVGPGSPSAAAGTEAPSASSDAAAQPDSGLTLAGIKKAAESEGYEVSAIDDYQMPEDPKAVDGITVVYTDESTSAYVPVLEFKNAADALAYADEVNESGYNLCIVNGKFLTMTSARYGIPVNDAETKLLEKLLDSTVMAAPEPVSVPVNPPAKDYAEACVQIEALRSALDRLVNRSVLLYDKKAAPEDRIEGAYFISFTLISSGDLGFTSSLSEDPVQIDAVRQVWELFGVSDMAIKHDTPNEYILTGQRMGMDTSFELRCAFDPISGSLRLTDTDGGQVLEIVEYLPLGNDRFAFQTQYERAVVEYKDGKITSFVYSLRERVSENAYADADSIYKSGAAFDEAWVTADGKDSYEQYVTYDGTTLQIDASSFMGDRLTVAVPAQ